MDLSKRAKQIIERIVYITIASVSPDGQPWNTPVFSAYDKYYNFYWGSYRRSQHSQNVRGSGKAFLVIYDSTVPAGKGEGVYISADVTELDDSAEIAIAHALLTKRYAVPYWKIEEVHENGPIRLYKAVPVQIWANTEGQTEGHYIDARTEIEL